MGLRRRREFRLDAAANNDILINTHNNIHIHIYNGDINNNIDNNINDTIRFADGAHRPDCGCGLVIRDRPRLG